MTVPLPLAAECALPDACAHLEPCAQAGRGAEIMAVVGQRSWQLEFSSAGLYCCHSVTLGKMQPVDHQFEYINGVLVPAERFSKWKPLWFVLLWPLHSKKDAIELEKSQTVE